MYLLFPTLYVEDTGGAKDDDLFVQIDPKQQGNLVKWSQVERICWGVYKVVGTPFMDYKECYRKVK